MSVRWRLTAWYAGTMLVCGALLLGVAYVVVSRSIDRYDRDVAAGMERRLDALDRRDRVAGRPPTPRAPAAGDPSRNERVARRGAETEARARQRQTVATRFAAALGVLALLSVAVGWAAAGRALRPVSRLTATARRVESGRLDERIALQGPRDELKELADTFDAMLERLEHAFAAQRRFVADASHELRTPLAIMRAELEATLADPAAGEPELRAMADVVAAAVERLERLIDALLELARSDSRPLAAHPVDLAELTEASLDPLAGEIAAARITVTCDLEPAPLEGDPALLERMVANLLENAVRHNRPGGRVAVRARCESAGAVLEVVNSGLGIRDDDLTRLFEPFVRSPPHAAQPVGSGLGLAIVRAVAAAHGGRVEARPSGDGGLRVLARLPAAGAVRRLGGERTGTTPSPR